MVSNIMRIFRAFLLRLSQILAAMATIDFTLMGATMGLQEFPEAMAIYFALAGITLFWVIFSAFIIKRIDPELVREVARWLFPAGAVLALMLSVLLAFYLREQIPGTRNQHYVVLLAGGGVFLFLLVRCLDIRFMRSYEEIPR